VTGLKNDKWLQPQSRSHFERYFSKFRLLFLEPNLFVLQASAYLPEARFLEAFLTAFLAVVFLALFLTPPTDPR
jgi:hypothetical protein